MVGWPIAHSRSPLIHRYWLRQHGIEGTYEREAVPPDALSPFLRQFGERGYAGGNVTLPHKEAAFIACAETTPVARRLRAANTLWMQDGALCGDNTDVFGFAANLDAEAPDWRDRASALVIGAGGAARAVVTAIVDAGFGSVTIINRTAARAHELATIFGLPVTSGALDDLPEALTRADLVVNATSAGLADGTDLPVDWSLARPDAIATDLVYVPLMTPFLRGAAARGLRVVDGLGMLLHQAAPGFERWFGVRPEVTAELRRLVVADLGA